MVQAAWWKNFSNESAPVGQPREWTARGHQVASWSTPNKEDCGMPSCLKAYHCEQVGWSQDVTALPRGGARQSADTACLLDLAGDDDGSKPKIYPVWWEEAPALGSPAAATNVICRPSRPAWHHVSLRQARKSRMVLSGHVFKEAGSRPALFIRDGRMPHSA